MAPKRKAPRAAKRSAATKRRAVTSQRKVLAALKEKADLSPERSDTLDYKAFNNDRLVLFGDVSPKGFESSAYDAGCKGHMMVLEEGKMMLVEAVDRYRIQAIAPFFFSSGISVTLGHSIRLTQDGSAARHAPLVFVTSSSEYPPQSLACNLSGYPWPKGVLSYGTSRTLPEHFEDGAVMLSASADGSIGRGIRFYLGIHEYSGTGQLVVFVLERQTNGSSSSSNTSGVRIIMREAVSCGTTGLAPSTAEAIKREIAGRGGGGQLRGVGLGSPACDKLGIPDYELVLPTEMLFDEDPIPPCFPHDGLKLDLFRVQAALFRQDFSGGGYNGHLCTVGCKHCDSSDSD